MLNQALASEAFCDGLNALKPGWVISGQGLAGPGGATVRFEERHGSPNSGHVDVLFELDETKPLPNPLWDCVSGFGATDAERAKSAAHIWSQTTAGALLELKYSLTGEFADHYRGTDADGFRGWHVICGAILGYGGGENPMRLQRWWLDHPFLPTLSKVLSDSLDERACPHGIKIFFGGEGISEIRLNGERHEAASLALEKFGWPRLNPPGFVRTYLLVLHQEANS